MVSAVATHNSEDPVDRQLSVDGVLRHNRIRDEHQLGDDPAGPMTQAQLRLQVAGYEVVEAIELAEEPGTQQIVGWSGVGWRVSPGGSLVGVCAVVTDSAGG